MGQVDGAEGSPAQDAGDAVFRELLVGGKRHSIPPLAKGMPDLAGRAKKAWTPCYAS